MRAASRSMRLPGIFGIARTRATKNGNVSRPVSAADGKDTESHPHAPSPVRPVGGVARAGGGGAHVHLPAGGCRRAGDQGRATGRRLRALLRQARRAARSVCSLPKLGSFPSPACGGGTGRGHATRFVRASSPPPPPPPPPPPRGGGGGGGAHATRFVRASSPPPQPSPASGGGSRPSKRKGRARQERVFRVAQP